MTTGGSNSLQDKTCVMTGATSGIGLAAAVELAARGARLVLVARNPARADEAIRAIHARTPNAPIEIVRGDLARLADVRDAADAILARCPEIHLLWNNAGVVKLRRELTADGFEAMFGVNHLAYFVMTGRLLDRLRATPGARIVSTASEAHRFGGALDFDDLQSERSFGPFKTYGRSKLCNILWTRELARRLDGSGVTANCFHPGAGRDATRPDRRHVDAPRRQGRRALHADARAGREHRRLPRDGARGGAPQRPLFREVARAEAGRVRTGRRGSEAAVGRQREAGRGRGLRAERSRRAADPVAPRGDVRAATRHCRSADCVPRADRVSFGVRPSPASSGRDRRYSP